MRKRYLVKRLARNMRTELSTYSREDLKSLAEMHVLFEDDAPIKVRQSYLLRKNLARQMLGSDVPNLGVSFRSCKRRKQQLQF